MIYGRAVILVAQFEVAGLVSLHVYFMVFNTFLQHLYILD